jgi:hypothetical protein
LSAAEVGLLFTLGLLSYRRRACIILWAPEESIELPVSGWWGPDKAGCGHMEQELGRARQIHKGGPSEDSL